MGSRAVRSVVGVVVLVLVLFLAGPAAAETELEVTTPADGRFQPGQPVPLLVTIEADRAVSGTLTVTFDGFLGGTQRVEVPGGSAKQVVLIANAPPWAPGGSLFFDADDGKDDDSTVRLGLTGNTEDELIAVFPDLSAGQLPATAELRAEVGQARLYAFDPSLLEHGAEILSPFSHVVVTADDLDQLDPTALSNLEAWLAGSGGQLVIDEPTSSPLPLSFVDGHDGGERINIGTGAVLFTDGRLADGGYDGELAPTTSRGTDEFPWSGGFGGAPTTLALARDAGVSIPEIGVLVLTLAAYILLAGPVLWFVLRRSRREPLLWIVLPLGALVATLGVYAAGRSMREEASSAHATVVADLPNIRSVSTQVLVSSSNGGTAGVELPEGWRATTLFDEMFFMEGPFGASSNQSAQPQVVGNEIVADLPPGGIGVLSAASTLPYDDDPSWAMDLADVDGVLTGTVTNLTEFTLTEGFVSAGQGYQKLSEVGPGESVEVSLQNPHVPPSQSDRLRESLWQADPWSEADSLSAVNAGILLDWLGRQPLTRTPGFVLVGGWTREADGPLNTSTGTVVESGRTVFLTANRIEDGLGGEPYRLELLRGWNSTRVTDPFGRDECGEIPLTLRQRVIDPAALGDDPVLDLSREGVIAFDLWNGSEWTPAGMADAPDERVIVAVPPAALADDELYLRVQLACEAFGLANPYPDLRASTAEDDIRTLGNLGEAQPTAAADVALDDDETAADEEEPTDG